MTKSCKSKAPETPQPESRRHGGTGQKDVIMNIKQTNMYCRLALGWGQWTTADHSRSFGTSFNTRATPRTFLPTTSSLSEHISVNPPVGVKATSSHPCADLTWIRTILVWFPCFLWNTEKLHCVWFLEYSLCCTSGRARWAVHVRVCVCVCVLMCALCVCVCACAGACVRGCCHAYEMGDGSCTASYFFFLFNIKFVLPSAFSLTENSCWLKLCWKTILIKSAVYRRFSLISSEWVQMCVIHINEQQFSWVMGFSRDHLTKSIFKKEF